MKQFLQENKGSISTFAILSIVAVLMILFLSINVGNIFATKSKLEDASIAMAEIVLTDQLKNPNPDPTNLIKSLDTQLELQASLGKVNYQYQFGYSLDGKTFIPLNISNPTPADFYIASGMNENTKPALALAIDTPMIDLGGLFNFSGTIAGSHITYTDPTKNTTTKDPMSCYCQGFCEDAMMPTMCMMMCMIVSTMMTMMKSMMTLDPSLFLSALQCLFSDMIFTMVSMADTAWNAGQWAWNAASTTVQLGS